MGGENRHDLSPYHTLLLLFTPNQQAWDSRIVQLTARHIECKLDGHMVKGQIQRELKRGDVIEQIFHLTLWDSCIESFFSKVFLSISILTTQPDAIL